MTAQQLKNSIFQLAIEGKLIEQNPDDEPVCVTPYIGDVPFDVPENWVWTRLGDVGTFVRGNGIKRSETKDAGVQCVRYGELYTTYGYSFEKTISFVSKTIADNCKEIFYGDILLTLTGEVKEEIGKASAYLGNDKTVIGGDLAQLTEHGQNPLYLTYFLFSPYALNEKALCATGAIIVHISSVKLGSILIPLPPLAEQRRIVKRIEELLPHITEYEVAETQLRQLNNRFLDMLRRSILQAAVQGKLAEQISGEPPVDVKPYEGEVPFDVPKNWVWAKLGDLGIFKKGPFGSNLTKAMFVPKGANTVKVYEQKNAIQKDATLGMYHITQEYFESKMRGFEVFSGDIIVSCAGTIGEVFVLPEGIEQGIINQALMKIKIIDDIDLKYFLLYFDFVLKQSSQKSSKGSAIKNIPPFAVFKELPVPLPPISEQKRIVSKIEELLAIIEK